MALTTVTASNSALPAFVTDPKFILPAILLVAGASIFFLSQLGGKPAIAKKREPPICYPTGAAAYPQGSKPLVKLGKSDGMAVERTDSTNILLTAIGKCTTLFCPGKGLSDYKTKLERYVTQRATMVTTFDTKFGDDGVSYAQQLFQSRDDDLILGDLKQRITSKQIPIEYVQAIPAMEMLIMRQPSEFIPCR